MDLKSSIRGRVASNDTLELSAMRWGHLLKNGSSMHIFDSKKHGKACSISVTGFRQAVPKMA